MNEYKLNKRDNNNGNCGFETCTPSKYRNKEINNKRLYQINYEDIDQK